jgi:hypothetical protein
MERSDLRRCLGMRHAIWNLFLRPGERKASQQATLTDETSLCINEAPRLYILRIRKFRYQNLFNAITSYYIQISKRRIQKMTSDTVEAAKADVKEANSIDFASKPQDKSE